MFQLTKFRLFYCLSTKLWTTTPSMLETALCVALTLTLSTYQTKEIIVCHDGAKE